MPGEYTEREMEMEMTTIERKLPALDRALFIQDWRTHPLVPTLADDDERRPKAGRVPLRRTVVQAAETDEHSEWTAVTEVDGEEGHGEFMKMRPGEKERGQSN